MGGATISESMVVLLAQEKKILAHTFQIQSIIKLCIQLQMGM